MYLVMKHSHKLYGPSDFKDERNFMSTLKVPDVRERMKNISSSDQLGSNQLTDAIDSLLNYSSIIGIFALYAVYLSRVSNKSFTLDALAANCEVLKPDYPHGFLVAASYSGAFHFTSVSEPFIVSEINERIAENIKERVEALAASDVENQPYLTNYENN